MTPQPLPDELPSPDDVVLPMATRDFLLQAMRATAAVLSKTNRLRATSHILVEEGIRLTQANSFQIDHRDPLLLMNLAESLLKVSADDA